MPRTKVPKKTIARVMQRSRRRCCICFGLHRDTDIALGQIAHLDHNAENNSIENLAFLCLEHHDEYDSKTSQRKGFTIPEVLIYRDELYRATGNALQQRVSFGKVTTPPDDPFAGNYTRIDGTKFESAEIVVTPIPASHVSGPRYYITGTALWGTNREDGPNIGELDHVLEVAEDGRGSHRESDSDLSYDFEDELLEVVEAFETPRHGMNVTFSGSYLRSVD